MFKKILRAFGVGGPSVDTVLADPNCAPGDYLSGEVRIQGGDHEVAIDHVALGLVTRVESERGEHESQGMVEFHRVVVGGGFRLAAGERKDIPFRFPVPWETPITEVNGRHLHGMQVGLRTELAVAGAADKGDLDPVAVHPLPAQESVLDGFGELEFRFASADVEQGRIRGVRQELPFYQEIEFRPPAQFAHAVNQVELTFVADPHGITVVLEADRRGGGSGGDDAFGRFQVSHDEALRTDWAGAVDGWLRQVASRRGGGHRGFHGDHDHHEGGGGFGVGAVVGGVAAGVVGAVVVNELFDEVGDFFGGDDD